MNEDYLDQLLNNIDSNEPPAQSALDRLISLEEERNEEALKQQELQMESDAAAFKANLNAFLDNIEDEPMEDSSLLSRINDDNIRNIDYAVPQNEYSYNDEEDDDFDLPSFEEIPEVQENYISEPINNEVPNLDGFDFSAFAEQNEALDTPVELDKDSDINLDDVEIPTLDGFNLDTFTEQNDEPEDVDYNEIKAELESLNEDIRQMELPSYENLPDIDENSVIFDEETQNIIDSFDEEIRAYDTEEEPLLPRVETPVAEDPIVEGFTVAEPIVEEPAIEEPVAEEPAIEEPVAEVSAIEEPVAEEPAIEEPVAEVSAIEEPVAEEPAIEEPVAEEFTVEEVAPAPIPKPADPNAKMSPDDIAALFASMGGDDVPEPEIPTEEPTVEESIMEEPMIDESAAEEVAPASIPEPSDPNAKMSPDDIAALFASMGGDDSNAESESMTEDITIDESAIEAPSIDETAAEEVAPAPIPEPSDPNAKMSDDDIAALFASMGGDDSNAESEDATEDITIDEAAIEAPSIDESSVEEVAPAPIPEPSDPNAKMSDDDIAALFASMGGDDTPSEDNITDDEINLDDISLDLDNESIPDDTSLDLDDISLDLDDIAIPDEGSIEDDIAITDEPIPSIDDVELPDDIESMLDELSAPEDITSAPVESTSSALDEEFGDLSSLMDDFNLDDLGDLGSEASSISKPSDSKSTSEDDDMDALLNSLGSESLDDVSLEPLGNSIDSEESSEETSTDVSLEENKKKKKDKKEKKQKKEKDNDSDKKPGFFRRLIAFLTDEEEDESVNDELNSLASVSDENAAILAEKKKAEKAAAKKAKAEQAKKDKDTKKKEAEKAKKEKEKVKKEKAKLAAEKKAKAKAAAIPEKPTKPIGKKKILVTIFLGISTFLIIMLLTSVLPSITNKTKAINAYKNRDYKTVFTLLNTSKLSGNAEKAYKGAVLVLQLSNQLEAYEVLNGLEDRQLEALNALIVGAGKYIIISQQAGNYGVTNDTAAEYNKILAILRDRYGVSESEALRISNIVNKINYTKELKHILGEDVIMPTYETPITPHPQESAPDVSENIEQNSNNQYDLNTNDKPKENDPSVGFSANENVEKENTSKESKQPTDPNLQPKNNFVINPDGSVGVPQ